MLESLDKPLPNEISTHESDKQINLPELGNLTYDDYYDYLLENISFTDNDLQADLPLIDDDYLLENISFIDSDLQADFPLIDDHLKTFGDIFNNPDSPWEGFDFSDHPTSNHTKDTASRPSHECKNQQVISELPSTAAKVLSEKDMNVQGPDSPTAMKSFKNRTTNLSSKRNRQQGFGKENC